MGQRKSNNAGRRTVLIAFRAFSTEARVISEASVARGLTVSNLAREATLAEARRALAEPLRAESREGRPERGAEAEP
jgi:hypothetical protein